MFREGLLMKAGDYYTLPVPNIYSVERLCDKFVNDLAEHLKPAGLIVSQSGRSYMEWEHGGITDPFNLTDLNRMTFEVKMVRMK